MPAQPAGFVPDGFVPDAPNFKTSNETDAQGHPIVDFLSEATAGLNPVKLNDAIQAAFWHPIETTKGVLAAQDVPRQKGVEAFKGGDYPTAMRHFVDWLIPFLGPRLDQAADYMQEGKIAKGLGATADVGLQIATPKIISKLPTSRVALADAADAAANSRTVDVMAPKVGPNKIRLGNMAADVAPDVIRKTTAVTKGGLAEQVGTKVETANAALDSAYDAIPDTKMFATKPVARALEQQIKDLSVSGPGGTVEPVNHAARIASLRQALKEINGLGSVANIDNLRKLRIAWDQGAKSVFTPATAPDFLTARGTGSGWADSRAALAEHMGTQAPETRPLNASVHLWTKAADVMNAAEEADRVRPTVGRGLMARGLAASVGAAAEGPTGAAIGAITGPAIERALASASPTLKIMTARQLARLADALRTGRTSQAVTSANQLAQALPPTARVAAVAEIVRVMKDVQPTMLAPAAQESPASQTP